MKKLIIGAIVGALILFFWQFLSWTALGIHQSSFQHTTGEDEIIEVLSKHLDQGSYMIPGMPAGASEAEHTAFMEKMNGQPWAMVSYHKSWSNNMTMNMIRGYFANLVAVFLLCWFLAKIDNLTFKDGLLASLAVGFVGFITIQYIDSVWFEGNSIPDLIDTVVSWGLVGAWLGFWMSRD